MIELAAPSLSIPEDSLPFHIRCCKQLRDLLATAVRRPLYPYQIPTSDRIIEEQLRMKGAEIIDLMARQSGKTEASTITILALAVYFTSVLKRPYFVGIFAPAKSQAIDVFRSRIKERFSELEPFFNRLGIISHLGKGRTTNLFFVESLQTGIEASIKCMSSDRSAQIKGETLDLIVIEQAEDANESKLKDDIFPMAAATGGIRVMNGTSTVSITNDYFFNNCLRGGPNVFIVDCYEAAKYNETYAAFIKVERDRYGPNSPEFAAQYELKWELVSNKFIHNRDAFFKLEESDYEPSSGLYRLRQDQGLRRTAAWDPARGGDYSWVTVVEGMGVKHIIDWWVSQGVNLETQAIDVGHWLRERGVSRLAVGVIGLGAGAADVFENHFPDIDLVRVNEDLSTQDKMFKHLDQEIANQRLRYPSEAVFAGVGESWKHGVFMEQMLGAERKYRGNKLEVVAPQGKARHDDAVDSLSICLWVHEQPKHELGVGILSYPS